MVAPFMPDGEKLAAIREALPAVGAGIYLDTPAAGPIPAEVAAAMAEIEEWELRTGRGGRDRRAEVEGRLDEARAAVAACLTVDLDRVTLAHGIQEAARLTAGASPPATWPAGLDLAAAEAETRQLADSLAAGRAAAAVVPLVTDTGVHLDVGRLRSAAEKAGSRLVVDLSHAAGAMALEVDAIRADHVVVRSDAWLLGPQAMAAIVTRADREPVREPPPETFHLPSVVGFARSCGWLSMYVGMTWATDRAKAESSRLAARLGAVDGVEVIAAGPIVTFRLRGWRSGQALDELGSRVFLVGGTVPELDAVRLGPGCWTTDEEIDRVVDCVGLLAAHTPDTLPPRRRLAILGQD